MTYTGQEEYFGQKSITLEKAVRKYKLSSSYIKKLIKKKYIYASDLTKYDMGTLIDFEGQQKLKVLSENPEYRKKILDFNPSNYYDFSTELISYHPYHDFIDRFCWLIKFFYSDKEEIKKKKYRLDVLFQKFITNNNFSIESLSRVTGTKGNEKKIIFHLQKGWYNELVRSLPLDEEFLNIGTKIKGSVKDSTSVSWNITQTYYSMYEYTNSLAFIFYKEIDTSQHKKPTNIFNQTVLDTLKHNVLFYPFSLSSKNIKPKTYPKHLNFNYASYPRDTDKYISDVNNDVVKVFKRISKESKGSPVCLIDFLREFRIWANYTGIDTITKLRNGNLMEYLFKNLGTLNFFIGGIAELSAIARLGEKKYMEILNKFTNDYILKQPQYKENILLIPIFIRHRIYKSLGIISTNLPYLSAEYLDPIIILSSSKNKIIDKKFDQKSLAKKLSKMSIKEIAQFIIDDWSKNGKVPTTYLEPMLEINNINDVYYADTASSIISYFLSNSSRWFGPVAKVTKKHLSALLSSCGKD